MAIIKGKNGRFVKNLKDKECLQCSKLFHPRLEGIKHCSKKCEAIKKTKNHVRSCVQCSKEFSARSMKTRFCSHQCYGETLLNKKKVECYSCARYFLVRPAIKTRCCSWDCSKIMMSLLKKGKPLNWIPKKGIEHHAYKHGMTSVLATKEQKRDYSNANTIARISRLKSVGGNFSGKEWSELKKAFEYMCLCCKKSEPEITLTIDHIIPLSKGGRNSIENIQPLCRSCNSKKSTKTISFISSPYNYIIT